MKNNFLIYLGCLLLIITCRMPSDPLGEIKIIKRLETINTGGNCLDIDVDLDIEDSILVVAANYNGYFIYELISNEGIIAGVNDPIHIDADEMDPNIGDNRAQTVQLSKNHNIAFVMDKYDHIWLYKYEDGAKFRVIDLDESTGIFIIDGIINPDEDKKLRWGLGKDDISVSDLFQAFSSTGTSDDRTKIARYCFQDCNLVHHLLRKNDIITMNRIDES